MSLKRKHVFYLKFNLFYKDNSDRMSIKIHTISLLFYRMNVHIFSPKKGINSVELFSKISEYTGVEENQISGLCNLIDVRTFVPPSVDF